MLLPDTSHALECYSTQIGLANRFKFLELSMPELLDTQHKYRRTAFVLSARRDMDGAKHRLQLLPLDSDQQSRIPMM